MTRADRRIMWQVVWSILAVGWAAASIVAIWRLPLVDGLTLGCLCGALGGPPSVPPPKVDRRKPCVWQEDWEGEWHTDCGNDFVFSDGGPSENGARYCQYCGRMLMARPYREGA